MTDTVHAGPNDDEGVTPCCGKSPFELPGDDRMTYDPEKVTCGVSEQAEPANVYAAIGDDVIASLNALGEPPERYVLVETPAYKEYRRGAGLLVCRSVAHPQGRSVLPCQTCLAYVDHVMGGHTDGKPSSDSPTPDSLRVIR